jgi:hypothetical protein
MSDPDTSPAAVERLADRLDGPVRIAAQDLIDAYFGHSKKCLASIPADESKDADLICVTGIRQAAATLRALSAERDEATNQLDSARHSITVLERRASEFLAERDALKAELAEAVEFLNALLKEAAITSKRGAATGSHWTHLGMAILKTRAFLARHQKEPRT